MTIKQIRDATFAASSARYRGEARFADDSSGELDGMAAADPAQGDVMVPVQTAAGVQQGELKWVDGDLYIQRVEGTPAAGATGTIGVFLRAATDRPWVRLPTQGIGQSLLSPYDPFSLLDQLTASVEVQPDGSESVDGRHLDRYVVDAAEGAALVPGIRRAELLTDKDHRLVVVRLSGDQTIEYTMSDYGTAVSVAAPPDDQIAVAAPQNRGEDPTGDYVRVAGGHHGRLGLAALPCSGHG